MKKKVLDSFFLYFFIACNDINRFIQFYYYCYYYWIDREIESDGGDVDPLKMTCVIMPMISYLSPNNWSAVREEIN